MFKKAEAQTDDDQKPAAPKAKKTKAKAAKVAKPKTVKAPLVAVKIGHNSGMIPAALEHVNAILELDKKIKEINKAKRDHRNILKDQFGVLSSALGYELSMRKKDTDVRIQIESNISDFKTMLGYQASLDLNEGTTARTEEEFADPSNKITADRISREG